MLGRKDRRGEGVAGPAGDTWCTGTWRVWATLGLAGVALDHEEQQIFPLLERHLSQREWRRFLLTERRRRPPRQRPEFLTWVLDDASDEDAAAVLTGLPRPAALAYRWVLRPRYDAERRWQPA